MTQITTRAEVATQKPVPYMRQLCKHFGHKTETSFGEDSGYIQFEFGRCDLQARDGVLEIVASAADETSHERLEHVVASHLERFGRGDELSVTWQR
jgi:hypothetical protein